MRLRYELVFEDDGEEVKKVFSFSDCYVEKHGFGSEQYWKDVAEQVTKMSRYAEGDLAYKKSHRL